MTAAAISRTSRAPTRILLVDDHPVLRAGIKQLLRSEPGLEVVAEAADGVRGVELALELRPDVVVMDVSMPGLGGAEATRQIKAQAAEVKVLVLSAHEEMPFARTLLEAGASGYALKRTAGDALGPAIHVVSAGGTYVDPAIAGSLLTAPITRDERSMPEASLSAREGEVLRLVAQGHTSKEMAAQLQLSPRTLETYKTRAMTKLGLRSRADLIRYAMRSGWLRDPAG